MKKSRDLFPSRGTLFFQNEKRMDSAALKSKILREKAHLEPFTTTAYLTDKQRTFDDDETNNTISLHRNYDRSAWMEINFSNERDSDWETELYNVFRHHKGEKVSHKEIFQRFMKYVNARCRKMECTLQWNSTHGFHSEFEFDLCASMYESMEKAGQDAREMKRRYTRFFKDNGREISLHTEAEMELHGVRVDTLDCTLTRWPIARVPLWGIALEYQVAYIESIMNTWATGAKPVRTTEYVWVRPRKLNLQTFHDLVRYYLVDPWISPAAAAAAERNEYIMNMFSLFIMGMRSSCYSSGDTHCLPSVSRSPFVVVSSQGSTNETQRKEVLEELATEYDNIVCVLRESILDQGIWPVCQQSQRLRDVEFTTYEFAVGLSQSLFSSSRCAEVCRYAPSADGLTTLLLAKQPEIRFLLFPRECVFLSQLYPWEQVLRMDVKYWVEEITQNLAPCLFVSRKVVDPKHLPKFTPSRCTLVGNLQDDRIAPEGDTYSEIPYCDIRNPTATFEKLGNRLKGTAFAVFKEYLSMVRMANGVVLQIEQQQHASFPLSEIIEFKGCTGTKEHYEVYYRLREARKCHIELCLVDPKSRGLELSLEADEDARDELFYMKIYDRFNVDLKEHLDIPGMNAFLHDFHVQTQSQRTSERIIALTIMKLLKQEEELRRTHGKANAFYAHFSRTQGGDYAFSGNTACLELFAELSAPEPKKEKEEPRGKGEFRSDCIIRHFRQELVDEQKRALLMHSRCPVMTLSGPGGSGKSTVIRALCAAYRPDDILITTFQATNSTDLMDAYEFRFMDTSPAFATKSRETIESWKPKYSVRDEENDTNTYVTPIRSINAHRLLALHRVNCRRHREPHFHDEFGRATYTKHAEHWIGGNIGPAQKCIFEEVRVLVIDECSLLYENLLANLLLCLVRCAPHFCRILVAGDHYQLPSIHPGNLFAELIKFCEWNSSAVQLEHQHRVLASSVQLSDFTEHIRNGECIPVRRRIACSLTQDSRADKLLQSANEPLLGSEGANRANAQDLFPVVFDRKLVDMRRAHEAEWSPSPSEIARVAAQVMDHIEYELGLSKKLFHVITRVNNMRTEIMNAYEELQYGRRYGRIAPRKSLHDVWVGDKIVFKCNIHKDGVVNNELLILKDIQDFDREGRRKKSVARLKDKQNPDHSRYLICETLRGGGRGETKTIFLSKRAKGGLQRAEATTVQAFQGAECPVILYVISSLCHETDRLVYTACTRASQKLYIICSDPQVFASCVRAGTKPRNSFLSDVCIHLFAKIEEIPPLEAQTPDDDQD